ncbi:trifunctional serine/threonine-protein kinase/ATP-binding protein/sensor histidine kinase [Roseofilum casamattae]|uniref:histidine kinase n=1 Tax=Roseofilum casamattae BLCC-M143 TaxID=3022442 RepID=A0ABT7C1C3_9CYAN|nr:ATP-binding sensor histidine kinase [Roseofilum casamattae]MDJ1185247.1 AAA family ATPase [Roseofilum casamattae BLCC-M143]
MPGPLTTPNIENYRIEDLIYESDRTLVYRGQNIKNEQRVAIKLMRDEYPSVNELVQFRNQYAIAKNLDLPGIITPYALERCENRYALIMKDVGGISLAEYRGTNSLPLSLFFQVSIQLADILHQLHQNQIIHKDIKPNNILIHPDTQEVQLIDFSISSLLPKETQTLQTPNVLEGTLIYLSPEQTGRMNRGIDYRSDFYSLGVTFYELLAGKPPFTSEDSLELIHAHIAIAPPAIDPSLSIPQSLSNIVMKLMAKNAENRYQSALGLKHDLEKCETQYRETGTIEPFVLGERDLCDRFIIPEKLYGRETEVKSLLDAFERVAVGRSEMMLVAGFSGIGKTAVINEVHKPIVRQKGYFIKGKFDQFNRNIPFSAFVQALRDLMRQLLGEFDTELAYWKNKILEAVGENGQVLINVIPELERIIGQQPPAPELSGTASQTRFKLLFGRFIAVFTTKEHPLTLFLDDLQWADLASLNLIKWLMGDARSGYLLLLGAYRDNEVFPSHPLMLTLTEIEKQNTTISTITLAPLSIQNINELVSETLSCALSLAATLTDLIYQKTQGNPFFSTQFLKGLYKDGLIAFNRNLGYWECDLVQVQDAALTDDVVKFMAGRLHKLPESAQNILKLAACVGNQFDLETLAIICETPAEEVAAILWSALQEGLILPQSETYKLFQEWEQDKDRAEEITVDYRFLHDRVQQAAYSLIPDDRKVQTHFNIGQLLLNTIDPSQREEHIFNIVSHLNLSLELIGEQTQRNELAQLNLVAAKKAKSCTANIAAFDYLNIGLNLLADDTWEVEYELTLNLHLEATEVSYLKSDFDRMEQLGNIVIDRAGTVLDRIKVYETQLQAYSVQNRFIDGINVGLQCLQLLGVELPNNPDLAEIGSWLERTQVALEPFTSEELLNHPEMKDLKKLSAMKILSRLIPLSYFGRPSLFPLISCQGILLSLEYGIAIDTPVSYVNYALVLCNPGIDNFRQAYEYGKIAKQIIQKQHNTLRYTFIWNNFYAHVSFWRSHLRDGIVPLSEAYQKGVEVGDLEFATYALTNGLLLAYASGIELDILKLDLERAIDFSRSIRFEGTSIYTACILQVVFNLINDVEDPCALQGEFYDEEEALASFQQSKNFLGLFIHNLSKLQLNYLFGNLSEARCFIPEAEKCLAAIGGYLLLSNFAFLGGLTYLGSIDLAEAEEKETYWQRINHWSTCLKLWSENAPMNYQHKSDLLEAERFRVLGEHLRAMELYDRAIAGAKQNQYLQEEALANELAAKFYLDWGKEKIARTYLIDAYYCYVQWGAKAKTQALEKHYPEQLKLILQRERPPLSSIISTSQTTTTSHSQTATVENISSILNFSSLLKASQTLSGEIELERLLSTLMKIILENAGATKGALLLMGKAGLTVEAIATRTDLEQESQLDLVHQSIPLKHYQDLPTSLINTVLRTLEMEILDGKTAETKFVSDDYLLNVSPQSLLCLPLLERQNLMGILYLENDLTADAFTSDRIEVLDALCAQATISLTNARLYQQAQQALADLQETQLQLVQNEKMATLGNLVAGVAHEINNPVSFIAGNVEAAQEHLQDLLDILALYQDNTSISESVSEEIEDLDPEFITEDFPKLIASMEEGCDRIRNISTSLRTFCRTDTSQKIEFNLHDGIDSTLLILKYRLKANDHRPAITIVKNYSELPQVQCYPGQLNQVFMNLLANAIDALDESNEGKTFAEIEKQPNCITIGTELSRDTRSAIVKITDNGMGMPEEVKTKIFQQGFTTKGVGKGTGLGMAIAQQIVIEKHGGEILCHSELNQGTEFIISLPLS